MQPLQHLTHSWGLSSSEMNDRTRADRVVLYDTPSDWYAGVSSSQRAFHIDSSPAR
jgi:hypothetical protein